MRPLTDGAVSDIPQIEDRSYNDAGMLTGVDRAYVDETRTYNAASQLTQIDNTSVGSQTYTYDLNGNVTSETLSGVMANYSFSTLHSGSPFADGYDAEDRFMRFKRSGVSEDILLTRSDIGNISNVNLNGGNTARGYNNIHGLTSIGTASQTYDTDGNTTTLHTAVTAAWDDAGRMKHTEVSSSATAGVEGLNEYGYVGGTRIWKQIVRNEAIEEHRVYIYAGPNLVAEYNAGVAASTPVQEYVYAGEIDSLVMIRRSNGTKYGVTRNRQWSITALHDLANGSVVERYAYEMTGKRTIYAANGTTVRTTSSYANHFGYTSRWHDAESGLMCFRARYYNPLTGEFLSRDPLEFVDGMSLYRGYLAMNWIDPYGYWIVIRDSTKRKASAFSEEGDTIAGLAEKIFLQAEKYANWLSMVEKIHEDGVWEPLIDEEQCPGDEYLIPNTVFIGLGEVGVAARVAIGNTPELIRDTLKSKGFYIILHRYHEEEWTESDVPHSPRELYGFAYFGHGISNTQVSKLFKPFTKHGKLNSGVDQSGWLKIDGEHSISPESFQKKQLGFLAIQACHAGQGNWHERASDHANRGGTVFFTGEGFSVAGYSNSSMIRAAENVPAPDIVK